MRKLSALSLLFAAFAAAQPSITSVVNAGSNDQRFCDGLLILITGNNFTVGGGPPTVIAGSQTAGVVTVNNNQIVAELPLTLSSGPATLTVNVNGLASAPYNLTIDNFAPAFYGSTPILDAKFNPITSTNSAVPGQAVVAYLVGLGQTNPLIAVGTAPTNPAPTTTLPTVTVGGISAPVTSSVAAVNAVALYQVNFTVPSGVPVGNQDVLLSIAGKSAPKTTMFIAAGSGTNPVVTSVVNAADSRAGLSPGVLAIVNGQNLGSSPAVSAGGKAAALIGAATQTQLTVQLPVDLPLGATTLTVVAGGQTSAPINLTIDGFSPAFFTGTGGFQDASTQPITGTNPAAPGKIVVGHLVGMGATTPSFGTGQVASGQPKTVANPTITVGNKSADYSYAGLTPGFIGLYQINFTIPLDVAGGNQDVVLTIGGTATPPAQIATSTLLPTFIGFRNAGSGQLRDSTHGVAPNTFLSIYASNIGTSDSQGNLFPATTYQGTQVLFNGTPAPLYNVLPSVNLINLVVPSELPETGTNVVTIRNTTGAGQNLLLTMASADVGVFRVPDPANANRQSAAATIANTAWYVLPAAVATEYKFAPCPAASPA
ncbi:MAG: IPT/TIG domain-containing protein, partial [Acidobacteriia bacterium]|nr:IPT/TIG domain-containing protein [Terriglobia bacterium]